MSEPITRGIYVLAHNGRLKVGYSTKLRQRLSAHRGKLQNCELLGFIPGNPEIDAATRQCLNGLIAPTKDWFCDTPDNRQLLIALGLSQYAPVPIRDRCSIPISEELHAKLKALADKEQRDLRTIAERFLAEGLEREAAHA